MKVEASFDGGATCTTAPNGAVTNPSTSTEPITFVTLRVTAPDYQGGTVTQTVRNAYQLR